MQNVFFLEKCKVISLENANIHLDVLSFMQTLASAAGMFRLNELVQCDIRSTLKKLQRK